MLMEINVLRRKLFMVQVLLVVILCFLQKGVCEEPLTWWSPLDGEGKKLFPDTHYRDSKTPSSQCKCPPNKECSAEFEINKDVPEFLKLRGVIDDKELKEYKKDVDKVEKLMKTNKNTISRRRSNLHMTAVDCCCPKRTIMIHTSMKMKILHEFFKKEGEKLKRQRLFPRIRRLND